MMEPSDSADYGLALFYIAAVVYAMWTMMRQRVWRDK